MKAIIIPKESNSIPLVDEKTGCIYLLERFGYDDCFHLINSSYVKVEKKAESIEEKEVQPDSVNSLDHPYS